MATCCHFRTRLRPLQDWRHILRFGRNVGSYKFALGRALLNLAAQQQTFVRLEDLSVPYAASISEHLLAEDRQSTSARSRLRRAPITGVRDALSG
jgi:hypothetical protein